MSVISESTLTAGPIPQATTWLAGRDRRPGVAANAAPATRSPEPDRPLHRLAEVRQQEGLTRAWVARCLNISIGEVQQQERPSSDISLSSLYRWQKVLKVPTAELLNEPDDELSPPVELRAQLLRIMKTVRSLQQTARQASVRRLIKMLVDQLVAVMPELEDIIAWPTIGRRRRRHELGEAFFRRLSLDALDDLEGPEQ
jgi:transcriptional regulator with XRE-family HTH domain